MQCQAHSLGLFALTLRRTSVDVVSVVTKSDTRNNGEAMRSSRTKSVDESNMEHNEVWSLYKSPAFFTIVKLR